MTYLPVFIGVVPSKSCGFLTFYQVDVQVSHHLEATFHNI